MKKFYAIFRQIFQSHIEIHVETMKKFHADLRLSLFARTDQISKKDTLKIAVEFQV